MATAFDGLVDLIADAVVARLAPRLAQTAEPAQPALISPKEAAKIMGRSASFVRQHMADGRIPASCQQGVGARKMLRRTEFEKWLKAQ